MSNSHHCLSVFSLKSKVKIVHFSVMLASTDVPTIQNLLISVSKSFNFADILKYFRFNILKAYLIYKDFFLFSLHCPKM